MEQDLRTPGAVVASFIDHARNGAWAAAATCFTPELLQFHKDHEAERVGADSWRPVSVEEHLKHNPDMPREVAEYFARVLSQQDEIRQSGVKVFAARTERDPICII